jgi:predicted pyridoxine 5'-phosphate oxidase superfamily flavin-nucleotide-binding protein
VLGEAAARHRTGLRTRRDFRPTTRRFADYEGNRRLLSTGNLARNERVSLFLMDYPGRRRLRLLGHARVLDAREHPALVERLTEPAERARVERLFEIDVVAFDWNCPKYITPRYGAAEVSALVEPLQRRIAELEARLAAPGRVEG